MVRWQTVLQPGYRLGGAIALGAILSACGSGGEEASGPQGGGSVSVGETTGGSAVVGSTGGSSSGSGGGGGNPTSVGGTNNVAGGGTTTDCSAAEVDTAPTVLRRLSLLEYQLTVQDLLALADPPSHEGLPPDTERLGFRTFAEYQTMSAENLRAYMDRASQLAADLLSDQQRKTQVIGCDTANEDCLADFVTRFGKLAYRRPLEENEVDEITSAAIQWANEGEDRFAFALEAMLSSAHFLYRVEVGDTPEGLSTLAPHELASRLSFALWGRGPSEQLLDDAAAGALDDSAGMAAVAADMLADDKTQVFFESFFRQWLGYLTLKPPSADEEAVFADMQEETDRLMDEFAWGAGDFLGALTANHSYMSDELAQFYNLPTPNAEGRVEFEASDPRANSGVLSHAALLSAKTDGDLIAMRGNWLRRTFLCEEIHLPESLADTIGELLVGLDRIGIVEARNTRTECATCHQAIDPIGIGLAAFDRTGIFDPEEDIYVFGIDPALPGAPEPNTFETVGELSAQLAGMPAVPACLTERAYLYMNGREPESEESCSLATVEQGFVGSNHDFRGLLQGLVESPAFRLRRSPSPSEQ